MPSPLVGLLVGGLLWTACDDGRRDNTAVNVRDRSERAVLPTDQSESPDDRAITQRIRQTIMGSSHLSLMAKNVKIITQHGAVTLRGPVETGEERATIAQVAQDVVGSAQAVENQLEIAGR